MRRASDARKRGRKQSLMHLCNSVVGRVQEDRKRMVDECVGEALKWSREGRSFARCIAGLRIGVCLELHFSPHREQGAHACH